MADEHADKQGPPPIVFTVRYTADDCLASAWRYWQRRLGLRYAIELAIGSGLLLLLATQGSIRWLEIALIAGVGLFAFIGAATFFLHWYRALQGLRALDPPQSTWTLTEDAIGQESSLGRSVIGWEALREVWRFDNLWLLVWGRDVYSSIPVGQLPRAARELIERRVVASGGRLR